MSALARISDHPRYAGAPEPWIKKRQLAAHLDVSERWIELRMREGLPCNRLSRGAVRFRIADVEAWLSERKAG